MADAVHSTTAPPLQVIGFEKARYLSLKGRLLEVYPELDDDTLADTLEGATNLKEALAALIRSALEDEALADGLRALHDAMKQRLARLEDRAGAKRQVALEAMEEAEIAKMVEPDFTASLRALPPSVVILSEADLPANYFIAQPPKIDRKELLSSLKAGMSIPGAQLSGPRNTLSVRCL